jgi:hypothetical protein
MTLACMFDRTGFAMLSQTPIAKFPCALKIGASLRVDPIVVQG